MGKWDRICAATLQDLVSRDATDGYIQVFTNFFAESSEFLQLNVELS